MIKCGYCNKEFNTIPERCRCEMECGKKQEEDARRKRQNELAQIKNDRDEEIANASKCLAEQINSFHQDYKEMCSAEYPIRYNSVYDYINVMSTIRKLNLL